MAVCHLWWSVWLLWLTFIFSGSCQMAENAQTPLKAGSRRPNILFVLTDDQDLHMDSLSYMPYLQKHLIDRGLSFNRHYCTVALCCPSRVSMWTGKAAHNTNVTDLHPPWGGYPKFVDQGFNENYLPIWIQAAGYNTYYVGKLFNAQTVHNYNSPHAAGWTGSDFLLDPYTYRYLNATFQRNHDKPVSYEGQYSTDVLAAKSHGFLEDALVDLEENETPFFLTVAPTAPHSDVNNQNAMPQAPPIPAERHKDLFQDVVVPRTPNFNPDKPGGASWISRLPKQNETNIDFNDHFYRSRLRSLQAVDEMIDSLVERLTDAGIMDNTYIFYSTDNGYSIGQHRRQPGKQCAFEEDVNVPLIVRGPGIPGGKGTSLVTTHIDLAPTFLSLAQAPFPNDFELDGQTIPLNHVNSLSREHEATESDVGNLGWSQEHVNIEMWGIIKSEGDYGFVLYPNHTYKALRIVGPTYNFLYTVWCSNEHELYDMNIDPYQINNLYKSDLSTPVAFSSTRGILSLNYSTPLPKPLSASGIISSSAYESHAFEDSTSPTLSSLINRLDSLMMVLKTCKGRPCIHPWASLFPSGEVKTLADALDPKFDDFFESQIERVRFDKCERGYIAESEGPMWDGQQVYGMFDEMAYD